MEVSVAFLHVHKSALFDNSQPIAGPVCFQLLVLEDRRPIVINANPTETQQPHEKKKRSTVAGSRATFLTLPTENISYDAGASVEDSICTILSEQVGFPIRRVTRVDTWTNKRKRRKNLQRRSLQQANSSASTASDDEKVRNCNPNLSEISFFNSKSSDNMNIVKLQKEPTYGKALVCIPANEDEFKKYQESLQSSKWENLQTIRNSQINGVIACSEQIMNCIFELEDWLLDMQTINRHFLYHFFTKTPSKSRIIKSVHNIAYFELPSTSSGPSSYDLQENENVDETIRSKHMLRAQMILIDKCEFFSINPLFENPLASNISDSIKYYYEGMDTKMDPENSTQSDYSYRYPLHSAASQKNPKKNLENLLEIYDPNEVDGQLRTPLHYACTRGLIDNAMAIIESSSFIQINAQDRKGNTALHLAVKGGHEYLVTLLLKHPAIEKDIENKNGMSPADYCRSQQSAVFKRMHKDLHKKAVSAKKLTVRSAGGTWNVKKCKENDAGENTQEQKSLRMILEEIAFDRNLTQDDKNVLTFFIKSENLQLAIRLSEYPADKLDAKRWNLTISAYKGIQYTHEEPYIFLGRNPFITFEEEQKAVSSNA
ncbi:hypothetical protein WR25_18243 [Diploscapter pachys]|uniref:Uncharacterized protein n=1 Tax=Diploscapter pachys TaxID=2018661 RepID=A0A2A2LW78_9BILA|nr:hypothetical protein WR25_18243 [Diploscapter pachys]